jgi:uncharacterized protein YndB with AHSA1/START domain
MIGVAVLVAVVLLVGWLLPVSHVAARRAAVAATPEALFALLIDVDHYPQWREGVTATQRLPSVEGRTRFVEVSGSDSLTFEILDATAPRRLVTRIAGEGLPFGGQWVFDVEPQGDKSRLTITEHGEVYSPLFRFVSRFVMGHTSTIDTYLGSVVRHFGESGTIEDAAPAPRAAP